MIIKFKEAKSFNQVLYYSAVLLFLINRLINSSFFSSYFPNVVSDYVYYFILFIATASFYVRNNNNVKTMLLVTSVLLMATLLYTKSGLSILMVILFLIAGANKYDLTGILKIQLFIIVIGTVFIVSCSLIGIIPNQIFDKDGINVNAFGFLNYATIPYLIFAFTILYLYLYKFNMVNLSFILCVDVIIFCLFRNRLMFMIEAIYLILRCILAKADLYKLRRLFILFPWIMCFIAYYSAKKYDKTNTVMYHINHLLSGRLYYGSNALKSFDIELFGKYIVMRGNIPKGTHSSLPYFYIDSGFIFSLLSYGLIFTIIIMVMYSIIIKYAIDKQNVSLLTTIIIICIANVINNLWVSLLYCPFILFFMEAFQFEIKHSWLGKIKNSKMRKMLCVQWD